MLNTIDIPLLDFIGTHNKLPDIIFDVGKKSKKFQLIYTLLSQRYIRDGNTQKNLLIDSETFLRIKKYLANKSADQKIFYESSKSMLRTLTIKNGKNYDTYLFIVSISNGSSNINILSYKEENLFSWLGGVVQKDDDFHISVQYNLREDGVVQLLDLLNFIIQLTNLKDFEQVYGSHSNGSFKSGVKSDTRSDLIHIDISAVREYIIPTTERKEHYRWQLCGPRKTILRRVKVKKAIVKEYVRKGKRIE